MSKGTMHEVHIFAASDSRKLDWIAAALPDLRLKTDCDPHNTPKGSICYEYPTGYEAQFEDAANIVGLRFEWGGGGVIFLACFVLGPYLYGTDGTSFRIWDVSDPSSPSAIAGVTTTGAVAIYIYNSKAFVAASNGNLYVVNIDDPADPTLEATVASDHEWAHIFVIGGFAFLSGPNAGGIGVYNITEDPPQLVTFQEFAGGTTSTIVRDRRIFFADASQVDGAANVRSNRIGGFQCHAISAGSLGADILDVGQVEARHGYFKGELVASALTIAGGDAETETGVVSVSNYIKLGQNWLMWGTGGDPNGVVTAPISSIFLSDDGNVYRNSDGATTWVAM